MFISKHFINTILDRLEDLERRTRRLELMELEEAKKKIAGLSDTKAGSISRTGLSTIEEIIKENVNI